MLVKCPKCGFDQPKDTYCANCGIEMASYKPSKPPLWKQIVKSPMFSLIVFIGIGYGAFVYLKNPNTFEIPSASFQEVQRPFSAPEGVPSTRADSNGLNHSLSTPEAPPATSPPPPPSTMVEPSTASTPTPASATMPAASSFGGGTHSENGPPKTPRMGEDADKGGTEKEGAVLNTESSTPESLTGPLIVEVRFVEAPQKVIDSFMAEASDNSGGDSGEMNYAIVKNASTWLNNKSFKELDRFTKNVPELKKKLQWFSGAHDRDTGAPIGLDFQISIQERTGGHIAGDLFLSRSMVEHLPRPETKRKEFMTHFETDVGSLIGLSGVMSRTRFRPEDKDLLQDSLLKIFISPSFLEGDSDLLLLFQFKGSTTK